MLYDEMIYLTSSPFLDLWIWFVTSLHQWIWIWCRARTSSEDCWHVDLPHCGDAALSEWYRKVRTSHDFPPVEASEVPTLVKVEEDEGEEEVGSGQVEIVPVEEYHPWSKTKTPSAENHGEKRPAPKLMPQQKAHKAQKAEKEVAEDLEEHKKEWANKEWEETESGKKGWPQQAWAWANADWDDDNWGPKWNLRQDDYDPYANADACNAYGSAYGEGHGYDMGEGSQEQSEGAVSVNSSAAGHFSGKAGSKTNCTWRLNLNHWVGIFM